MFEPTWESLRDHRTPEWFRDAKFGIWAHWGPQSVAMAGDWYARHLYGPYDGTESFEQERSRRQTTLHRERFGHPSEFGHKDLCNAWKAEQFDPDGLMQLYKRAGARYFMSMAAHCDNFDLWDSAHQRWNATRVGPRSDILGRWAAAARDQGLHFTASMHAGSWTWRWLDAAFSADGDGHLTAADGKGLWWEGLDPRDLYGRPRRPGEPPDPDFIDNFYARLRDLVTKHQPQMIYLDDSRLPFDEGSVCEAKPPSDAGLCFVADYYNQTPDGTISIKQIPEADREAVLLDLERSQRDTLQDKPFQFDTSIGDWFYRAGEEYKTARQIVHMLVDTVSKNGCLLLNVMQRPDGTLDDETVRILEEVGEWTSTCGEAIYGTRPWTAYGEGPTHIEERGRNEADRPYTARDIRFTTKNGVLYATFLAWPADSTVRITSITESPSQVTLLGSDATVEWSIDAGGLTVRLPAKPSDAPAYSLRIA